MIPKLTDDAVGRLPLAGGRAALLEEVLREEPAAEPRRPRRWLAPLAAAAVVAGIAGGSLWWPEQQDVPEAQAAAQPGVERADVVLDARGWEFDSAASDGIVFRKGEALLEITSYPADSYASYVTDREHIVDPPAPGRPIEVLGEPAQMWAYSADDHTAIRVVDDGRWLELRAQGVSEAGYLELLGELRLTTQTEFEAALPEDYTTEGERLPHALSIIGGITEVSGAGFPGGESLPLADGEAQDPYQFGAEIVGAYTCAWLEAYEDARTHQQPARADEALRVLGTARRWPILREMDADGDYPEVVWQIADEAKAGELQPWYREGLGC